MGRGKVADLVPARDGPRYGWAATIIFAMFAPFQEEHDQFRVTVRAFVEREIAPHADQWEKDRIFPSELFRKAGALGILGAHFAEEHGGGGGDDGGTRRHPALRGPAFPHFRGRRGCRQG